MPLSENVLGFREIGQACETWRTGMSSANMGVKIGGPVDWRVSVILVFYNVLVRMQNKANKQDQETTNTTDISSANTADVSSINTADVSSTNLADLLLPASHADWLTINGSNIPFYNELENGACLSRSDGLKLIAMLVCAAHGQPIEYMRDEQNMVVVLPFYIKIKYRNKSSHGIDRINNIIDQFNSSVDHEYQINNTVINKIQILQMFMVFYIKNSNEYYELLNNVHKIVQGNGMNKLVFFARPSTNEIKAVEKLNEFSDSVESLTEIIVVGNNTEIWNVETNEGRIHQYVGKYAGNLSALLFCCIFLQSNKLREVPNELKTIASSRLIITESVMEEWNQTIDWICDQHNTALDCELKNECYYLKNGFISTAKFLYQIFNLKINNKQIKQFNKNEIKEIGLTSGDASYVNNCIINLYYELFKNWFDDVTVQFVCTESNFTAVDESGLFELKNAFGELTIIWQNRSNYQSMIKIAQISDESDLEFINRPVSCKHNNKIEICEKVLRTILPGCKVKKQIKSQEKENREMKVDEIEYKLIASNEIEKCAKELMEKYKKEAKIIENIKEKILKMEIKENEEQAVYMMYKSVVQAVKKGEMEILEKILTKFKLEWILKSGGIMPAEKIRNIEIKKYIEANRWSRHNIAKIGIIAVKMGIEDEIIRQLIEEINKENDEDVFDVMVLMDFVNKINEGMATKIVNILKEKGIDVREDIANELRNKIQPKKGIRLRNVNIKTRSADPEYKKINGKRVKGRKTGESGTEWREYVVEKIKKELKM